LGKAPEKKTGSRKRDMEAKIEQIAELESRVTLAVPALEVKAAIDQKLNDTARKISLKGFRPGRVPTSEVRRRFGDEISEEVIQKAMVDHFFQLVKDKSLRLAGQPTFNRKSAKINEDLVFEAVFESLPEIQLADLSKIQLVKKTARIGDQDLAGEVERIQKSRQTFVAAEQDRAASLGDKVHIVWQDRQEDSQEKSGDEPAERALEVMLDEAVFPASLVQALVGATVGSQHRIQLDKPAGSEQKKEQENSLACRVTAIEVARLPELNEEFFKMLGDFEPTLEGLKQHLRPIMEERLEEAQLSHLKTQMFDQLTDLHKKLPVPKVLVKEEAFRLSSAGPSSEADNQDQASKNIRLQLIFQHLVEMYELKVSKEDIAERINKMAAAYPDPKIFVQWYYSDKNRMKMVEGRILEDLLVNKLFAAVSVEEQASSYKDVLGQSTVAQG